MSEGLRQTRFSPIPGARVAPLQWKVDPGRRLAVGGGASGGNPGTAGDGPGGNAFLTTPAVPFIRMAGGATALGSKRWTGAESPTVGDTYGPRQIGGPSQNPRQPYRRNAGWLVQIAFWPKPQPAHLAGGALSLGLPTSTALTQRMAALLQLRRTTPQTPTKSTSALAGLGVGTRAGIQRGVGFGHP